MAEANGADRLSARWSCSKASQSANPMAPVIVAQIYGAVKQQEAEDQGVSLYEGGVGGGGRAGMDEKNKFNRDVHDAIHDRLWIALRWLLPQR